MEKSITFSSKWFDHEFESMIASKLRLRFPEFVFSHVQDSGGHTSLEAWEAWEKYSGLDIRMDISDEPFFKKKTYDLTPFLKKSGVNLHLFDPDLLMSVSDEHGIFGLPFCRGTSYMHALFYNADLFTKFDVPPPQHGMTWDDVINLAEKVTGTIDGISYCGLDIGDYALLKMQMGIRFLDPETHQSRLLESDCQEYFRIIKAAYGILGNIQDTKERLFVYGRAFRRDGTVAMSVDSPEMFSKKLSFKLGAVNFPQVDSTLRVPSTNNGWFLTLHPESQQKQEAFEVIAYLVSDEFQLYLTRLGRFSSLTDKKYEEEYGQENPTFSGINMEGVFQGVKVGWRNPRSPYEIQAGEIVKEEMERAVRKHIHWDDAMENMENRIRDILNTEEK